MPKFGNDHGNVSKMKDLLLKFEDSMTRVTDPSSGHDPKKNMGHDPTSVMEEH